MCSSDPLELPPLKTEGDTISRLPFCSQSGSGSSPPMLNIHPHQIRIQFCICCSCFSGSLPIPTLPTTNNIILTHPHKLTWYGQKKRYSWLDQHYHPLDHHYRHHDNGQRYPSGKIPNVGDWGESESQVKAAKHFSILLIMAEIKCFSLFLSSFIALLLFNE